MSCIKVSFRCTKNYNVATVITCAWHLSKYLNVIPKQILLAKLLSLQEISFSFLLRSWWDNNISVKGQYLTSKISSFGWLLKQHVRKISGESRFEPTDICKERPNLSQGKHYGQIFLLYYPTICTWTLCLLLQKGLICAAHSEEKWQ